MSSLAVPAGRSENEVTLAAALEQIAGRAAELDASPRFPAGNIDALRSAGVLQLAADRGESTLAREIELVRAVARADGSTSRILDGHFNGVERVAMAAPGELREEELRAVGRGELVLGVWGADPSGDEGAPAYLVRLDSGELVLRGVKTFCSGAGGIDRALVVARDDDGARRLAYVDARAGLEIDRSWYRASGLRSSESHRVEFRDARVLAVLGEPDELARQPWFARDAVRTAATWAGLADAILAATIAELEVLAPDDVRARRVAGMRIALATIDRWLDHTGRALSAGAPAADPASLALETRAAISFAARTIGHDAVEACGSRALSRGGTLDRSRRDLEIFLLQHRLDPKLVELGHMTLGEGSP
jgi:alkylation response protein AidB-like acyl-CoA dehydrogenase